MLPRDRRACPHVFGGTKVLHDLLWSWLLPNAAYDLGKQVIVSLVLGVSGAAL
jgi:hypothetical protein